MVAILGIVAIYWGIGGEHGPFDEQKEGEWAGWPNFGQVMKSFRKKARLTAKAFGVIYGKAVNPDGSPISERQVLRMELENQVPMDMNRRKLIARLLNIPPMLFGLAVLENLTLQPHPQAAGAVIATGQTTLQKIVADTTRYQKNIRTLSTLHYTSQVQSASDQINADIRDLESLESQTQGDLLQHILELLCSYQLLAAKVVRDQRKFSQSHHHTNQAVRAAKAMSDSDLIAAALYTRGCTYLEWGMFGTIEKGVFQVQCDKINNAIRDFEDAKKVSENGEKGLHPQLLGLIKVHLSRAYAILTIRQRGKVPPLAITMLDEAEGMADSQIIDDPHTRMLITGSRAGFVKGGYHTDRASALNAAEMYGAALQELNALKALQKRTLGRDLTRSHAWLDIVSANTFMGLGEFPEATKHTRDALVASLDINSITNLTNVVDIHGRLLNSTYKASPDVQELGDMLRGTLTARIEQKE
jgi:hypothetical protein